MASALLAKRQWCDDLDECGNNSVDWVIRYVVVAAVVIILLLYVFLGMWHANRRIKQGKQPLFYHRWMVPARTMARLRGENYYGATYYPPNQAGEAGYQMHDMYRPPPPVYSPNDGPPKYEAPLGPPPGHATKDGPSVSTTAVAGESSTAGAAGASSSEHTVQAPAPTHQSGNAS